MCCSESSKTVKYSVKCKSSIICENSALDDSTDISTSHLSDLLVNSYSSLKKMYSKASNVIQALIAGSSVETVVIFGLIVTDAVIFNRIRLGKPCLMSIFLF